MNGSLLTVGGEGDSTALPASATALTNDSRCDDELYDLKSFITTSDGTVVVKARNPSADDNIFLATFVPSRAMGGFDTGAGELIRYGQDDCLSTDVTGAVIAEPCATANRWTFTNNTTATTIIREPTAGRCLTSNGTTITTRVVFDLGRRAKQDLPNHIGKLYVHFPAANGILENWGACTATVIDDHGTLLTAAHCLFRKELVTNTRTFTDYAFFAPGYKLKRFPLGGYSVSGTYWDGRLLDVTAPNFDQSIDYAFLRLRGRQSVLPSVDGNSNRLVGAPGASIQSVTNWANVVFDRSPSSLIRNAGYPQNVFARYFPVECSGLRVAASGPVSLLPCVMAQVASGGPVFDATNTVVGINGSLDEETGAIPPQVRYLEVTSQMKSLYQRAYAGA